MPGLKDEQFTVEAAEIIRFTGEERNGNAVLTGSCAKCGQQVAPVTETSQVDSSGN